MNTCWHKLGALLLGTGLLYVALLPQATHAEVYIAGQIGGAYPFKLTGLQGDQSNPGATLSDVLLRLGPAYGGKLGYYSSDEKWLGMELEAYQSLLHVKPQTYTRSQSGTTTTGSLTDTSFKMTTYALNLLVRYPDETFQPYAGIGVGLFTPSGPSGDNTTAAGLNLLGGLRYKFGQHLGAFGELKYNRATIDFRDPTNSSHLFQGTYSAVLFVVGLSLHF